MMKRISIRTRIQSSNMDASKEEKVKNYDENSLQSF